MSNFPQSLHPETRRPTRIKPTEYTPAVLRVEDGSCTQATLELFSLTGGLLSLPKPLHHGSRPRLMFLTKTGPVLGVAEMLKPVSWTEQPFRFIGLHEDDQHRLRAATGFTLPLRSPQPHVSPASPTTKLEPEMEMEAAPPVVVLADSTPALDTGEPWIQKYRAALDSPDVPRRHFSRIFAALTVLALGAIAYVLQAHLLR